MSGDDQQSGSDEQLDGDEQQSGETDSANKTESTESSATGAETADNNTPYLYLLLALMAGVAIVTVGRRRRTVRK